MIDAVITSRRASVAKFQIIGADRAAKLETQLVVEASSDAVARAIGEAKGVIVAHVDELDESNAPIARVAPSKPKVKIPRYGALEAVASFLVIIGAFGVIIGGGVMAYGIHQYTSDRVTGFPIIAVGVSATVAAFAWYVMGEAISAFRDMAINSWHARRD